MVSESKPGRLTQQEKDALIGLGADMRQINAEEFHDDTHEQISDLSKNICRYCCRRRSGINTIRIVVIFTIVALLVEMLAAGIISQMYDEYSGGEDNSTELAIMSAVILVVGLIISIVITVVLEILFKCCGQ